MRISPKATQFIAWTLCWGAAFIAVAALFIIIGYVLIKGVGVLDWEFLSTDPKGGLAGAGRDTGGIRTAIIGTGWIIALTLGLSCPLGIGAGIYMAEYARDNWLTAIIRWVIETLAGIPSIIFGLFGFALFVTILELGFSVMAGALALSCLILPTVVRTVEEALKAVPRSFREGGYALGATKWQTIRHIVLPSAIPGIITAVILALGRAVEETAVLYLTLGLSRINVPETLTDPGTSLSLEVFYRALISYDTAGAFGAAVILVITVIIINASTRWISSRWMAKMEGR